MAPALVGNRAPIALGEIPPAYRDWRYSPSPAVAVWPYFEDPDGDSLTFTARSHDSEILTVTVADGFVEVDARQWRVTTVTVTATDPGGLTAEHAFESGNVGPTPGLIPPGHPVPPRSRRQIPSLQVLRGQKATVDLRDRFSAHQPGPPTFEATSSSPGTVDVSVSGDTLTIDGIELGSALVNVTARTHAGVAKQQFTVVVDPPTARLNSPPVFRGTHRKVIPQGIRFFLDVAQYFSDPEGDALTYRAGPGSPVVIWSISGDIPVPRGEATASLVSRDRLGVTGTRPGFLRIRITATDLGGLPVSGDLMVEVAPPVRR